MFDFPLSIRDVLHLKSNYSNFVALKKRENGRFAVLAHYIDYPSAKAYANSVGGVVINIAGELANLRERTSRRWCDARASNGVAVYFERKF